MIYWKYLINILSFLKDELYCKRFCHMLHFMHKRELMSTFKLFFCKFYIKKHKCRPGFKCKIQLYRIDETKF